MGAGITVGAEIDDETRVGVGQGAVIETDQEQVRVRTVGQNYDQQDFENIVLRARDDGSAVYLRDVARIELGQSEYNFYGEINGTPAVNVALYLLADLAVSASIARRAGWR